jgi:hypothetical protein
VSGNRVKGDLVVSQTVIQQAAADDPRDSARAQAALALLQGPVDALGLGTRLIEAEELREAGNHQQAAEAFLSIAGPLEDAGRDVSAELMRERAANALKEAGDHDRAFDLYVEVAHAELARDADGAQFTARRAREVAPKAKEWLAEGLMARALWPEHEDEVVPVLAQAWEETRDTHEEAEWAAALVEVLSLLGRLDEALEVAEEACVRLPLSAGPRLWLELDRLDAAGELGRDVENEWRRLLDWTHGRPDELAALVLQRRGAFLSRRERPEESVEAFRQSATHWGKVRGGGDEQLAESYFAEQVAWELAGRLAWKPDGARAIASELGGDPKSASARAQRLVDRGLRELLDGKHLYEAKRCLLLALATHRRAGNLRGILEAHHRLARLFQQVGEGSRALAHYISCGDEKRAGELARETEAWEWPYIGDALRLDGPSWERAASYAVLAEAGGRMPDADVASLAPSLIAAAREPSYFAPGPQPAHQGRRALAAVACALPEELLDDALEILRGEVRQGGWADKDAVRALGLVTRLGHADATQFLLEASLAEDANAVKNEAGLLIERLRDDAGLRDRAKRAALEGNAEALDLLAYAGLEEEERELRDRCSERVRNYVDAPEPEPVPGERSAALVVLLELGVLGRYCEPDLKGRLAERLLRFALDTNELDPSRATAVGALTNLAGALDQAQAERMREGLLTLALGAYGSNWQESIGSDHPFSRFKISIGRPGELRAAAIDALCELVAEHGGEEEGLAEPLGRALASQDATLVQATLKGLIRLPDLALGPEFSLYLRHPEARVRATALRLLASRDHTVVSSPAALALAGDPSRFVRSTLLGVARDVGKTGEPALEALSQDTDAYIRRAAARARA